MASLKAKLNMTVGNFQFIFLNFDYLFEFQLLVIDIFRHEYTCLLIIIILISIMFADYYFPSGPMFADHPQSQD